MDSYRLGTTSSSSTERLAASGGGGHRHQQLQQQQQQLPQHPLQQYSRLPAAVRRGPPSNASRSGSGSEIYERLQGVGGGGGGVIVGGVELSDDDSDVYNSSMDRGGRRNGREPADTGRGVKVATGSGERLVKPSQIKKNKKQGKAIKARR
jgi:hypothetical protein